MHRCKYLLKHNKLQEPPNPFLPAPYCKHLLKYNYLQETLVALELGMGCKHLLKEYYLQDYFKSNDFAIADNTC